MFSLNGFKNIKNILIISFISLLLLSLFFCIKFFQKINTDSVISCDIKYLENNSYYPKSEIPLVLKICSDLQIDVNSQFKPSIYKLSFDRDDLTYFKDFVILNSLQFAIKKKRNQLGKSKKQYKHSEMLVDIWRKSPNNSFKLLDAYEQLFFVATAVHVKTKSTINVYSFIYVNIFDDNKYVFHFVIFVNFLILLILSLLFYKILRILFPLIPKILSILIISNIIVLPYFWVYFISFYKEPFILISMTLIVYNYVCFLTNKINFIKFIYYTLLLIFAFIIIRHVKYEYFSIYSCSFILSILLLNLYKKNVNFFLICCIQLITVFSLTLIINPTSKIISNGKAIVLQSNKFETTKNLEPQDYFSGYEITVKVDEFLSNIKQNTFKDYLYHTREIDSNKNQILFKKNTECLELITTRSCKKFNNFLYKISAVKNATLAENGFIKSEPILTNNNIINKKTYPSSLDVLKQLPISAIRGYFMPIMFSSNKLVVIFSTIKIIGSILFLYYFYLVCKNKYIKDFQIISGIILIFFPLNLSIDLITSNYFTYLRYVYPFNIFIVLITFSFVINQILKMKND